MRNRSIVTNDVGRVFLQSAEGLLSCCPEYLGCVGMSGISQDRDENITIKCLSDTKSGEYVTLEKIPGLLNELSFDLTSYLGMNGISTLREMFQTNCEATLHVHFGCSDPRVFTDFTKAMVFENVLFNSYSTDDLISLEAGNVGVVTETTSATAEGVYEYFAETMFSLVSQIDATDDLQLQLMPGSGCDDLCAFCSDCTLQQCAENFWTIPTDDAFVGSYSDSNTIYTVESSGIIKRWNYDLIVDGELSCSVIGTISLETGETVTATAFYNNTIIAGTSDGNVYLYNVSTGRQSLSLNITNSISVIEANEFGYLVADSLGNIYYSSEAEVWSAPTNAGAGPATALLLYSENSWLVATANSNLYYTNSQGDEYISKKYPSVNGLPIKQFAQSNTSILHAINDTHYYQSFDAGCNWTALDLSKYFSEIFSIVVCPNNPFVLYVAGLSVDGTQTYIVEVKFGA